MKTIKTKLKGLIAVAAAFSLIAIFNTSAEAQGFRILTAMELTLDDPIFGDRADYWVARVYAFKTDDTTATGGGNNSIYFSKFNYHYSFDTNIVSNPKYLVIKNRVPFLQSNGNGSIVSYSDTQGVYIVTQGSATTNNTYANHSIYDVKFVANGVTHNNNNNYTTDQFVGTNFNSCIACGEILRVYLKIKPGIGDLDTGIFPYFEPVPNPNEIYFNPAANGYLANTPNSTHFSIRAPGQIPTNPYSDPVFFWPHSSLNGGNFKNSEWSNPQGFGAQGSGSYAFGGFSIGAELDPLPVEYASFNAIYNAKAHEVAVQWTTAMELNNSHFTVEHSVDGENWMALSVVEGNGTTYEQIDYEYIHSQPVRGANFYRLIQEDFDGTQAPSNTIMVYVSESELAPNIRLYPNPSFGTLNIEGTSNPKVTVFNTAGVSLLVSENQNTIDLSHLKTGVYFIQVEDASGITSKHRFIKE